MPERIGNSARFHLRTPGGLGEPAYGVDAARFDIPLKRGDAAFRKLCKSVNRRVVAPFPKHFHFPHHRRRTESNIVEKRPARLREDSEAWARTATPRTPSGSTATPRRLPAA
ncbi:MAG TPA: hypothetical protein VG273_01375 [Bryobacteraceae bacterium]|nr:hypothetical protein [Bryobacteraceae bacterium]